MNALVSHTWCLLALHLAAPAVAIDGTQIVKETTGQAVQAALAMLRELEDLNRTWAAGGRPTLAIGVGINTGEMVAGNIGSETIMSYTVIGDAVNLGSRLESLNKQYGTSIIASETTRARLKGRYDIRPLGEVVVKGKTRPVAIFEIAGPAGAVEAAGAGRS